MRHVEWLECEQPDKMIDFLRRKRRQRPSDRKFRLFVVACVRHVWHLLSEERCRKAVEVAEQHADSLASLTEMSVAGNIATIRNPALEPTVEAANAAARASAFAKLNYAIPEVLRHSLAAVADVTGAGSGTHFQVHLLHEVFGNPFNQQTFDTAWLNWSDGIVLKIAQAIYEHRAFDRMPILADALEEGGCTDADILGHCRQPGSHVKGCWILDRLLGKN
jgi:hypothetical protein